MTDRKIGEVFYSPYFEKMVICLKNPARSRKCWGCCYRNVNHTQNLKDEPKGFCSPCFRIDRKEVYFELWNGEPMNGHKPRKEAKNARA